MIPVLIRLLGRRRAWQLGRKIYMSARGEYLNRIDENGEALLAESLIGHVPAGQAFVGWDVGANVGDYTAMLVAQAQKDGTQYAIEQFEPAPQSQQMLTDRFADDRAVRCHALALSNMPGTATFELQGATAGTNTLEITGDPEATLLTVKTDTADNVAAELEVGEIDLFKIDAEGHDLQIIKGAEGLLAAGKIKVMQFEYNFRWVYGRHFLKDVFEIAERHGYHIGIISPSGILFYSEWNAENERFFEANYVLARPDVVKFLPHEMTSWDISNTAVQVG